MATLVFPIAGVNELIDHAINSPDHTMAWQPDDEPQEVPAPQLMFVKDSGIYLMSNGLPRADEVVYAKGYDPTKADVWDKCQTAVGGDDFAEYLSVDDLFPVPDKAIALVVKVTKAKMSVAWRIRG